ncbi:non-canonical purine NTP pyrophosphatase [Patescibacteria group bacterium]|nr:non-canonical purine NTP pyrophosphatase [Patescibacteria group bacterium]
MKLLVATKNPAKQNDYKQILQSFDIEAISLKDIGDPDDVEETGKTLLENACLKAEYFAKKHLLPTIADDSGFEIDALGGEPGIYARRWPGYEASDEELIEMVRSKLAGIPKEKRTAKFTNMTVLADKTGKIIASGTGYITGFIPLQPSDKRWPGFPYRSCLFVPQFNKYWGELLTEEYKQINFRYTAVKKLLPKIKELI